MPTRVLPFSFPPISRLLLFSLSEEFDAAGDVDGECTPDVTGLPWRVVGAGEES